MIKLYASGKNIEEIDVGVEGGITLFTDDPKELDWVEALCFEAHGEKDPFDFIYAALVDEGSLWARRQATPRRNGSPFSTSVSLSLSKDHGDPT